MSGYTSEELEEALRVVSSIISRCEKSQLKFAEGTSQHTLLKNRIKAMYISKSLLTNADDEYTNEELTAAVKPITSVISKCGKAQSKYVEGTSQHARFQGIIDVMNISNSFIADKLGSRE